MTEDNSSSSSDQQPERLCQECSHRHRHHSSDLTVNPARPRPALYQCPRCSRLTCSLACCLAHKARLKCSGQRDKTKFVPVSQMNDATLRSDYHFLEDIVGTVDKGQRLLKRVGAVASVGRTAGHQSTCKKNKRPSPDESTEETTTKEQQEEPPHTLLRAAAALALSPPFKRRIVVSPQFLPPGPTGNNNNNNADPPHNQHAVPPKWRTFQRLAAERSTTVLFMPAGMARHQSNRSHVRKGDSLHWTIEWCWHTETSGGARTTTTTSTNNSSKDSEMKPIDSESTSTAAPTTTTKTTLTPETAVVGDVLQTIFVARNDKHAPQQRQSSMGGGDGDYSVLLKKLPCPSHQPLYIEIAPTATVRDALQHATVYEYPTFHVVSNSNSPAALQARFPRLIVEMKGGDSDKLKD